MKTSKEKPKCKHCGTMYFLNSIRYNEYICNSCRKRYSIPEFETKLVNVDWFGAKGETGK